MIDLLPTPPELRSYRGHVFANTFGHMPDFMCRRCGYMLRVFDGKFDTALFDKEGLGSDCAPRGMSGVDQRDEFVATWQREAEKLRQRAAKEGWT